MFTPYQSTQSSPPVGNPLKDEGAKILAQVNINSCANVLVMIVCACACVRARVCVCVCACTV